GTTLSSLERPGFFKFLDFSYKGPEVVNVTNYSINADFSNVLHMEVLTDEQKQLILQNGFVVAPEYKIDEFCYLETYYSNTDYCSFMGVFVTTDSILHTYHLFYRYLLEVTEENYLCEALDVLSGQMYNKANEYYEQLKGTEWENAALRNLEYFTVTETLLGKGPTLDNNVINEVNLINSTTDSAMSHIMLRDTNYKNYIPNSYYVNTPQMTAYYKVMTWLGDMSFDSNNEEMNRSALLMSLMLSQDEVSRNAWERIYAVTSFFAGQSDNETYCEYYPAITEAYGYDVTLDAIKNDKSSFKKFNNLITSNYNRDFALMGKRFAFDLDILKNLYSEDSNRTLPSALDVPAALGSETALNLAVENGAENYSGYKNKVKDYQEELSNKDDSFWKESLNNTLLYSMKPLLEEKGEGYPSFMKSDKWNRKSLNTFLASYTELKHSNALYEHWDSIGGGAGSQGPDYLSKDHRGYVEPEPEVYARLVSLTYATIDGLQYYNALSETDKITLSELADVCNKLTTISEKELRDETLSRYEYELIRDLFGEGLGEVETDYNGDWHRSEVHTEYVGFLSKVWKIANDHYRTDVLGFNYNTDSFVERFAAPLVTTVASNNQNSLEEAIGYVDRILVIIPIDGVLRVCHGVTYSYFEFEQPTNQRATDRSWKQQIGIEPYLQFYCEANNSTYYCMNNGFVKLPL
ncbi:MAG: DUF3160 domain-containing protein, partial [Erysipelotrichaceae bacterium]|nr:DUF3160 domain-containing protein [Erysipelotrichaceae bacterium]